MDRGRRQSSWAQPFVRRQVADGCLPCWRHRGALTERYPSHPAGATSPILSSPTGIGALCSISRPLPVWILARRGPRVKEGRGETWYCREFDRDCRRTQLRCRLQRMRLLQRYRRVARTFQPKSSLRRSGTCMFNRTTQAASTCIEKIHGQ